MIGLEYIAKEFRMEYKEIGERMGVSKQTIYDWLKTRKKIPEKRLEQLSNIFSLPEAYFQKELDHIEQVEIRMAYLKSISGDVEIPQYNEEGEIIGYYTSGTYEAEIQFWSDNLEEEKKKTHVRKGIESLLQEEIESVYETKPLLSDSSNTETFNKVINIMNDEKMVDNFKVIVHLLNANDGIGGNITLQIHPEYRNLAREFQNLLKKYGSKL
ncbi:helix-turn-helix domain-containing protein [Bacillus mycoides]|uniref:helix-turn-helix domain-containing protein n=1 Tax=Bacillus mycoides TaxID=1405 RepID=UPI001C029C80|nr:helix-turn-helix transcriptional regulator [Bacillus mycoides]QWI10070.1 XRE family transcriptional regulator [Bacillus mycoides]